LTTDCTSRQLELQGFGRRILVAAFDGGQISSDGGLPVLRAVEQRRGIIRRFAACFEDHREPSATDHSVEELVGQRVYALAAGYEDLNDHDELRHDPLLAAVVGKSDPTGASRRRLRDRGKPLAGSSSLQRLEWGLQGEAADHRYRRIAVDPDAVDRFFVDVFVDGHERPPRQITLDLHATDDPIHGSQEGRFSTATTETTATCRCTSSAVPTCCALGCGAPTSTPQRGAWRSWSASSARSASRGRG
jgi:Transposase DDE domain group 1